MARKKKTDVDNKQQIYELFQETSQSLLKFVNAFIVNKPIESAKFHYWLSDILLKDKSNIAIEAFREASKTTFVVYGFPLYCLTFPHNSRSYIVLLKASDDLAKQKLHDVRDMYFSNKILSANVQKIYQKGDVLDILTKEGIRVRIEAYGKGTNVRGLTWQSKRPDIVIMDDMQTLEDVRSETIAERDWEWFLSDIYMLSKASRIFMIGNNLGDRCVIEKLSKNPQDFGFKFFRIPAIKNGKAAWPAKFTTQFLEKEREAYSNAGKIDIWLRERMCQSVAPENMVFKKENLNYYDKLPKDKYNVYVGVDLATSLKRSADYSAIAVIYINNQNIRFIEEIRYGRWLLDDIINNLFDVVSKHRPNLVAIEKVAFQSVMEQVVKKEMLKRNAFFNVDMLSANRGAKVDKILSLQPLYAAGAVYHKRNATYLTEYENELLLVSRSGIKSEHDDLMDAVEMANHIAKSPAIRGNISQTKAKSI